MAKNKAFFSAAAAVHPRFHAPVVAIVSQGLCAILMTLTPFRELITYIGMSLTLFTVLSVASLFVFRRKRPGWLRLRAVDFAYPLVLAAYILVGTCMIVYGLASQPGRRWQRWELWEAVDQTTNSPHSSSPNLSAGPTRKEQPGRQQLVRLPNTPPDHIFLRKEVGFPHSLYHAVRSLPPSVVAQNAPSCFEVLTEPRPECPLGRSGLQTSL